MSHKALQILLENQMQKLGEWKRTHMISKEIKTPEEKKQNTIVLPLEEFFKNEITIIRNLDKLKEGLEFCQVYTGLTKQQKDEISAYISDLDQLIDSYTNLNFLKAIENPTTAPDVVIETLKLILTGDQFKTYTDNMMKLALKQDVMSEILWVDHKTNYFKKAWADAETKAPNLSVSVTDYTIRPVQHIPRYSLQWATIHGNLSQSGDRMTKIASKIKEHFVGLGQELNKAQGIKEGKKNSAEKALSSINMVRKGKPVAAAKLILNFPVDKLKTPNSIEAQYPGSYLQTVLIQAYPQIFETNRDGFAIKEKSNINPMEAFGYEASDVPPFEINESRLNPTKLQDLYNQTGDPTWLALKTNIPIGENFPAEEKIKTFKDLADLARSKKLGEEGKYITAYQLQQQAFSIAKEHQLFRTYNECFGPGSGIDDYIIKKIKEHKTQETYKPITRQDMLTACQDDDYKIELGNQESAELAKSQLGKVNLKNQPLYVMEKILGLNLNNPKQQQTLETTYLEGYLKVNLSQAFNDLFELRPPRQMFAAKGNANNSMAIEKALGHNINLFSAPEKGADIDPSKFNPQALQTLYEGGQIQGLSLDQIQISGDRNPLWLVLKSTLPVSKDFSAEEKINTYKVLAELAEKGEIGKNKSQIIHNLQQAAFAIAKEHDKIPEYLSIFRPETSILMDEINEAIEFKANSKAREIQSDIDAMQEQLTKVSTQIEESNSEIQEATQNVNNVLTAVEECNKRIQEFEENSSSETLVPFPFNFDRLTCYKLCPIFV